MARLPYDDLLRIATQMAEDPSANASVFTLFDRILYEQLVAWLESKKDDPMASIVVSYYVAANTATPDAILGVLAEDPQPFIRNVVANNPATPAQVLAGLSRDSESSVAKLAMDILQRRAETAP